MPTSTSEKIPELAVRWEEIRAAWQRPRSGGYPFAGMAENAGDPPFRNVTADPLAASLLPQRMHQRGDRGISARMGSQEPLHILLLQQRIPVQHQTIVGFKLLPGLTEGNRASPRIPAVGHRDPGFAAEPVAHLRGEGAADDPDVFEFKAQKEVDQMMHNGPIGDGNHRLRPDCREGPDAAAGTGGQQDCRLHCRSLSPFIRQKCSIHCSRTMLAAPTSALLASYFENAMFT